LSGHWAGARVLLDIVDAAAEQGVRYLTVFGFSTENWQRPNEEIEMLFSLFETYLRENRQAMVSKGIKFEVIGNIVPFPEALKEEIRLTQEATQDLSSITLVVALNYGARDEIVRAVRSLVSEGCDITEEAISGALDTRAYPEPDLLIRTSGELRLSNFLLWQLSYAEIYVTPTLWPEFTEQQLLEAISAYKQRKRRYGG